MPIRLLLELLFAAATASAAAVGGTLFVTELGGSLRGSLLTSLQMRADAIAQQLPDGAGNRASGVQMQKPGSPAPPGSLDTEELTQILDANGRVLDGSGPGTSKPLMSRAQLATLHGHSVVTERAITGLSHRFLLLAFVLR